jgi:hypothetical protein
VVPHTGIQEKETILAGIPVFDCTSKLVLGRTRSDYRTSRLVRIQFVLGIRWRQYERTYYRAITDKTMPYFIEDLQGLGFHGSSFRELDPN